MPRALNQLDITIRDGTVELILPYGLQVILGHDVAGVVVKVGPSARTFCLTRYSVSVSPIADRLRPSACGFFASSIIGGVSTHSDIKLGGSD
jgi:NADPH:quinone reductase-like Zn-dependent oxidoreductase